MAPLVCEVGKGCHTPCQAGSRILSFFLSFSRSCSAVLISVGPRPPLYPLCHSLSVPASRSLCGPLSHILFLASAAHSDKPPQARASARLDHVHRQELAILGAVHVIKRRASVQQVLTHGLGPEAGQAAYSGQSLRHQRGHTPPLLPDRDLHDPQCTHHRPRVLKLNTSEPM